ncbi:MAG: hypothetical protein QG609_288, partial [Patescibacteria group bacterium]|nr:hypothetical protein [Patescibacteria group bacterium]
NNSDLKELEEKDKELLITISSINQANISKAEKARLIDLIETVGDHIHDLITTKEDKITPSESTETATASDLEKATEPTTINEPVRETMIPPTNTNQGWMFTNGENLKSKNSDEVSTTTLKNIENIITPNTTKESLPNTENIEKKFLDIIQELNDENNKPIYKEDADDSINKLNNLWNETEQLNLPGNEKNALLSNIGKVIDKIYEQIEHLPYRVAPLEKEVEFELSDEIEKIKQENLEKDTDISKLPFNNIDVIDNKTPASDSTGLDLSTGIQLKSVEDLKHNSFIGDTLEQLKSVEDFKYNPFISATPEELAEIKESLAQETTSGYLLYEIEDMEKRVNKVKQIIEALPEDKKEKTIYTLNTLGYQIDKWKNNKIADLLEKSASTLADPNKGKKELRDQSTLTRFLHGLAKGRRLKAEQTENTIKNIQAGKTGLLAQAGNLGRPIGTALKVGRLLGDYNIANPLRYVMFIASTTEEISRGAKEARLSSDAVLRKQVERNNGLRWHEKEAIRKIGHKEGRTEEEIEADILVQETAQETQTNLENTLYGSLTRKMRSYDELKDKRKKLQRFARVISKGNKEINKLDEARLLLSGMTQGIAQWQNKFWLDRVQKKLNRIEDSSLSIDKKETRKQKLFASYENKLKDMERMMSGYGAIDTLAMTARNVENASKAVVIGMMADSLYKAGKYAYENDMFGFMDWAEKIIEEEKNTPDDLESDVLPINPTYTEPIKVSLADSEKILEPETIKKSRFSLFENTGATIIEDPQGKVSVTYEIGNNGDFNSLDQALRRVVMQAYDDQTPNIFDKVEAARLENTLANVREILQGQTINGITPLQIKESAQLVDGNLVISDYNKFEQEILKPLFKRAAEKIDQDSPIIKYSQATNESMWQEMLGEKNGSKIASIEPSFTKEVTPPENLPSEFTDNEIKRTSLPVEKNILNGSEPIEDLKQVEIKTPTPSLLDQASSDIQTRFRLPEEAADKIVNTLMIDSKGNLDQNQLQIFNDTANRTQNPDAIFSALDITRSLNWDSGQEMKLARAFVNPEKINLWQDVFGKDMIPENAKVKIDGTKLSLHKVGGMGGALSIDFAEQKITLGRLLRPGGNGWATDSARFFHFSPSSQNTFGEALSKATQAVRQAK